MIELTKTEMLSSILAEIVSVAVQGSAYESWDNEFARKEIDQAWKNESAPLRRKREIEFTVEDLRDIKEENLKILGFGKYKEIILVPIWVYHYLKKGEILYSIAGQEVQVGSDDIDFDVRGGLLAYGFHMKAL